MDTDIVGKLETVVEKCTTSIDKIGCLKEQCSKFLSDIHAAGQPLFSQYNRKKIDEKLSRILGNFDQLEFNDLLLTDEAFSYTIPHHPKETSNPDVKSSPTYEMEHVEGDKPWLFMLKYRKGERWKFLKQSLQKNLLEKSLKPYENIPPPGSHVLFSVRNRVSRGLILQILSPQRDGVHSVKLLDVDSHEIKFVASTNLYHVNVIAASLHSQILHCFLDSDFDSTLWPGELNNIFARVLRDKTLIVTPLSRRNDDDIETTYVPSYAVKVLAVDKEEEVVIDVNEWILNHVYPALERSNGSYHSMDLNIFDPNQYCLSDEECAALLNEDIEDRLADFDDAQTEVMSCLSEMTITQRDSQQKCLSVPLASSEKNNGLSPHAIEFSFASSTSSNVLESPGVSDKKSEAAEEMLADLLHSFKQETTEDFDNILHTVFSQDKCKDLVSNTSNVDKIILSSSADKPEIPVQSSITQKPKETDVEEIPVKSVSKESEIVETKESSIISNLDSKQEKVQEKSLKIGAEAETVPPVSSSSPVTTSPASSVAQPPTSTETQPSSVTQPPTTSESQLTPMYQFTSPNLVASYDPDPRLYPRRSSQPPISAGPPGFIPARPAPNYQQMCPPPPPMIRQTYYGMTQSYQGPPMYPQNQYPNQNYSYNQSQANFGMGYYQTQPRFGPPVANLPHMYNPVAINSTPMSQRQPSPYPQYYAPMMPNQASPFVKNFVSPVSESTPARISASASGFETKKRKSSNALSYASSDSKESLSGATEAASDKSKPKNAQSRNGNSLPDSVSQSKWSTNDLEGSPIVSASSLSSKLSTTVPVFVLPKSTESLERNAKLSGVLTYYVSPHHFYMRLDNENNSQMEKLANEMFDYYCDGANFIEFKSKQEAKSVIGDYAACLWEFDQRWYRIEITDWNIEDENDENVDVYYVDFGNAEKVQWTALQPLMKDFTKLSKMATRCSLANIQPAESSKWGSQVEQFIYPLYDPSVVVMIKVEDDFDPEFCDCLLVDIAYPQKYGKKTIRELLVEKNIAVMEESEVSFYEKWNPMSEDYHSTRNSYEIDTDDACQAVSGYKPTDDARICQFYAEKGHCWKKNLCNKEHVKRNPDVFTTDKVPVYGASLNQLDPPAENSEMIIKVTEVTSLNRFYANLPGHLAQLPFGDNTFMKFSDLMNQLNNKTNVLCFKHLTTVPAPGELVIAKDTTTDFWYRGRVVLTENSEGFVQVFFVDLGPTAEIPMSDLRQMESTYLQLPFQAVVCTIANVTPKQLDSKTKEQGLAFLSDLLKEVNPLVKVIQATPGDQLSLDVLVKAKDADVGEALIEAGFCDFQEIVDPEFVPTHLPG